MAQARPYRWLMAGCAVLAVVLAPIATAQPWLINKIVDEQIAVSDMDGLLLMTIIFVAILFLNGILQYVFIYSTNLLGQSVVRDLRLRVFTHINSLRLSYFDKTPIGTSTTRTINDIETINTVFSQGVITIIADMLTVITVLAVMFATSVKLTVICLVTMPFMLYGT